MKVRELQLKLATMRKTGLINGNEEVYVCIIRENGQEEKVKLVSVGCCDGGYIPNGDIEKDYVVLDGFEGE